MQDSGLLISGAKVWQNGVFSSADVLVQNGKIVQVGQNLHGGTTKIDAQGQCLVPGFIDLHTHGAVGVDINAASGEGLGKIANFFAAHGTTAWLASVLTDTEETTLHCIEQIVDFIENQQQGAMLLGVHLEGPFLAAQYKGAMPEHLLQNASAELFAKYCKAAKGHLRYITVSPEVAGVPELIPQMQAQGVKVAIGHSGCDYQLAMQCIENGASAATHTFNAMKLFHQHEPAIMGAVMESDVYCEAICDGFHLHPGAVRLLLKTKGAEKIIAVTDSIMATGLPDGEYMLGVNEVVSINGDVKLKNDGSRAGSTLTMDKALRNLQSFTKLPMEKLMPLVSGNAACLLGLLNQKGSIAAGFDADMVLLNDVCEVEMTLVGGCIAYQKAGQYGLMKTI